MSFKTALKATLAAAALSAASIASATNVFLPSNDLVVGYNMPDGANVSSDDPINTALIFPIDFNIEVLGTPTTVLLDLSLNERATSNSNQASDTVSWALTDDNSGLIDAGSFLVSDGIANLAFGGLSGDYVFNVATTSELFTGEIRIAAVPLPAAALLFGTALAGFAGFSARRKA